MINNRKQQEAAAELACKTVTVAKAIAKAKKLLVKSRTSRQQQADEQTRKKQLTRAKEKAATAAQLGKQQNKIAKSALAAKNGSVGPSFKNCTTHVLVALALDLNELRQFCTN